MIRKLTDHDIEAVNEIYNQAIVGGFNAYTNTISLQERKLWFQKRDESKYPSFVFERNEEVAAWLYFSLYRSGRGALQYTAEVSYYVHQKYRGEGIGNSLLKFAIDNASTFRFKYLVAILLSTNTASISLLEKHGFAEWGKMPGIAELAKGTIADHLYYGAILK